MVKLDTGGRRIGYRRNVRRSSSEKASPIIGRVASKKADTAGRSSGDVICVGLSVSSAVLDVDSRSTRRIRGFYTVPIDQSDVRHLTGKPESLDADVD